MPAHRPLLLAAALSALALAPAAAGARSKPPPPPPVPVYEADGSITSTSIVTTGLRARRETVKPWPGESAPVRFDGPSRVENDSDNAGRCMSKTIETRLTGTIDVKLRR